MIDHDDALPTTILGQSGTWIHGAAGWAVWMGTPVKKQRYRARCDRDPARLSALWRVTIESVHSLRAVACGYGATLPEAIEAAAGDLEEALATCTSATESTRGEALWVALGEVHS